MKLDFLKALPAPLLAGIIYFTATFPVLLSPKTLLPGQKDALFSPWNLYQFQKLAATNQHPYFTRDILYPYGASLLTHAYTPITSLISLLVPTQNYLLKTNLLLTFGITTSALLTTLFLRKALSLSYWSSTLGALFFSTSPFIFSSLATGHLPYTQSYFLPLLALLLYWWHKSPRTIKSLLISLCLWINLINESYQGLFGTILFFAFLISFFFHTPRPSLRATVILILAVTLPAIPLSLSAYHLHLIPSRPLPGFGSADICKANFARFLLPSPFSLVSLAIPSLSTKLSSLAHFDSPSVYIGFSLLCLSFIGFLKYRRLPKAKLFLLITLLALLFSAGPIWKIGPLTLLSPPFTPYSWFSHLPLLSQLRCPIRTATLLMFGLSPLAALGFDSLRRHLSPITLTLIFILALLENLTLNLPFSKASLPSVYHTLSLLSPHYSLLEFPSGFGDGFAAFGTGSLPDIASLQAYLQTIHRHPRIGGHTSRLANSHFNRLENEVFISDLWRIADLGPSALLRSYTQTQIATLLSQYQIGYIILWPIPHQSIAITYTTRELSSFIQKTIYADGFVLLLLNPPPLQPSHKNLPSLESENTTK